MIERDIWLTANLMIKQYGTDAEIEAAMRVDETLKRGDLDGRGVWRRVLSAVRSLTTTVVDASVH